MQVFNVLDRTLNVHQSYLLEASAGTGKTFSIENIVLRLLLEADPIKGTLYELEELLIVTFTRAATQDLKRRIRSSIDDAKQYFTDLLDGNETSCNKDFLKSYRDAEEGIIRKCIHILEKALFSFDQAQILTIHGFCSKMLKENVLEGGLSLDINLEISENPNSSYVKAIRDFFRSHSMSKSLSLSQKQKLKKYHSKRQDITFSEAIESKLLKTIQQGLPIIKPKTIDELFNEFCIQMKKLKNEYRFNSDDLNNDLSLIKVNYKEVGTRFNNLASFTSLFDLEEWTKSHFNQLIETGILPLEVLIKLKQKVKLIPPEQLKYDDVLAILEKELKPIIDAASHPDMIYALLAYECKEHVTKFMREEEIYSFNDLLTLMKDSLNNEGMKEALKTHYKVAIIDEFQDTDPVQWEIFRQLFLSDESILYLVGDPKQSIYAFRQADIYTYLDAKRELGEGRHASLNTNYRSTPELIEGLNHLFDATSVPGLISLPGIDEDLPYQPVLATDKSKKAFQDHLGAVHFCLATLEDKYLLEKAETEFIFPFIANKIKEHHQLDQISYKQMAILIADRFQADRIAKYLRDRNINCVSQKTTKISDSKAIDSLRELLKAVIYTRNNSAVKVALGGKILSWDHHQISTLENYAVAGAAAEIVLYKFQMLRTNLYSDGISLFFQALLNSRWHEEDNKTVAERILGKKNGLQFFTDLEHVVEFLRDFEEEVNASPDRLLVYLDEIKKENIDSMEKLARRTDPSQDAVTILTGHSSKGLEYEIVFPLGLLKRTKEPEMLFPYHDKEKGHALLSVCNEEDPRYLQYCDEMDAEKMRQLYVCMTRAKYRLYLPIIEVKKEIPPARGCASPMDLYLARLDSPLTDTVGLYERMKNYSHDRLISYIQKKPSTITYHNLESLLSEQMPSENEKDVELLSPPNVAIHSAQKYMYSFSGLTKSHSKLEKERIEIPPKDYANPVKTPHTLPASSETGNLLHILFQELSFADIRGMDSSEELIPFINIYTEKTPFHGWEEAIATLVWKTLKTPIMPAFCLCDLDHLYKEMEFIYPYKEDYAIEELKRTQGYLKGVIDLTFYHEGKYYLLDWKSNWLGSTYESYTREMIVSSMHEHDYFLQAKIYKEALKRYLKATDARDFEEIYGGTFYIFLRGIEHEGVFSIE